MTSMTHQTAWEKPELNTVDAQIIGREDLYNGFFRAEQLKVRHRLFRGGWSGELSRELFLRNEAVGVLLYDPKQDWVGLVEQFRVGALDNPDGPWCMEVVAGMVEPGESIEEVARRELQEESGVAEVQLEYICQYLPSPGACNESMHLLCGLADLTGVGGIHGLDEEQEDIKVHVIPAQAALDRLYQGRFNNSAVLLSLQWLALNRSRLRELGVDTQSFQNRGPAD